jgi:hypothetical protein
MAAYVTTDELVAMLGTGADVARAELAALSTCDWIDARTGKPPGGWNDPFLGGVPPRIHQLALNGAMRFYHDPEAPYGIVGDTREIPMYMRSLMTDADALLLGLRSDFGIG